MLYFHSVVKHLNMSDSETMEKKIEDSLIDLYLNVKVRTTDEVMCLPD
jgi:hypothetical protein